MDNCKKISLEILLVFVVIFCVFAFTHFRKSSTVGDQTTLERIKDTIIKNKDCNIALPKLAVLLKNNSHFAEGWQWQGICQFQNGDMLNAKASFEKALALDPKLVSPQNYLKVITRFPSLGNPLIKNFGKNTPDGFLPGLLIAKPVSVIQSYTHIILANPAKHLSAGTQIVFSYIANETRKQLTDTFSAYLKKLHYSVELPPTNLSKSTVLFAKTETKTNPNCYITISDTNTSQRVVQTICLITNSAKK